MGRESGQLGLRIITGIYNWQTGRRRKMADVFLHRHLCETFLKHAGVDQNTRTKNYVYRNTQVHEVRLQK